MGRRGRPKLEPTKLRSIRLPIRIWDLLDNVSAKKYRSVNIQIRKLIEDFLVAEKVLQDKDRGPIKFITEDKGDK